MSTECLTRLVLFAPQQNAAEKSTHTYTPNHNRNDVDDDDDDNNWKPCCGQMQHKCLFCMSDHIKVIGTRSFNNLQTFSVWLALSLRFLFVFVSVSLCPPSHTTPEKKQAQIFRKWSQFRYECYSCRIWLLFSFFLLCSRILARYFIFFSLFCPCAFWTLISSSFWV